MPTSATGRRTERRPAAVAARGVTLIELVVVLAILSLLALPAVLRLGGGGVLGGEDPTGRVAAQLRAELGQARDRALLGARPGALAPQPDGWDWLARDGAGGWAGQGAGPRFPGLVLEWELGGTRLAVPGPVLPVLPDGRTPPLGLRLTRGREARACHSDGWDELTCTGG